MEKLFDSVELLEIQCEATTNLDWYHCAMVVMGNTNEKTIRTISKAKHLIFVEGNGDTGYIHLSDRHNCYSYKNYWIKNEFGFKLDDPSKFHPEMITLIDYVKICEVIFSPEIRI